MSCDERYHKPGDDWHAHPCGKPAKWTVDTIRPGAFAKRRHLCGLHVRRFRRAPDAYRVEPLAS